VVKVRQKGTRWRIVDAETGQLVYLSTTNRKVPVDGIGYSNKRLADAKAKEINEQEGI